jgi:hypothetical protein
MIDFVSKNLKIFCYLVEAQELDLDCLINFEIDLVKERYNLEDDLEVNERIK